MIRCAGPDLRDLDKVNVELVETTNLVSNLEISANVRHDSQLLIELVRGMETGKVSDGDISVTKLGQRFESPAFRGFPARH